MLMAQNYKKLKVKFLLIFEKTMLKKLARLSKIKEIVLIKF
jgi:hypothetical protein